jgi:hypothetical protein
MWFFPKKIHEKYRKIGDLLRVKKRLLVEKQKGLAIPMTSYLKMVLVT